MRVNPADIVLDAIPKTVFLIFSACHNIIDSSNDYITECVESAKQISIY